MKLVIAILITFAISIEIKRPYDFPDGIEENAQAQKRSRWIACLLLCRAKLLQETNEIQDILFSTKHDPDLTKRKILADILYNCNQKISWKDAEELITDQSIDLNQPFIKSMVKVDRAQFLNESESIELTPSQIDLLDKIEKEYSMPPDELSPSPYMVVEPMETPVQQPQFPIVSSTANYYLGVIGGVFLFFAVIFIIKKVRSLNVGVAKKKPKVKKY